MINVKRNHFDVSNCWMKQSLMAAVSVV